jgi:FkbM family methyltransferase
MKAPCMLLRLYRTALRLPNFRGKSQLVAMMRRQLEPASTHVQGFKMQLDPVEWIQSDILSKGELEPRTCALFHKLLKAGDTYVDVGAHVGYHSLLARQIVGPDGHVLAVEPQPYNANKIQVNSALNGYSNISVDVGAAGEIDGVVRLYDQVAIDKSRLTLVGHGVHEGIAAFEVPVWTLDTLLKRFDITRIRLLKIDVEGYELAILKGAHDTLRRVENVIFEALPDLATQTSSEMRAVLSGAGFSFSSVDGTAWEDGVDMPESNVWAHRV